MKTDKRPIKPTKLVTSKVRQIDSQNKKEFGKSKHVLISSPSMQILNGKSPQLKTSNSSTHLKNISESETFSCVKPILQLDKKNTFGISKLKKTSRIENNMKSNKIQQKKKIDQSITQKQIKNKEKEQNNNEESFISIDDNLDKKMETSIFFEEIQNFKEEIKKMKESEDELIKKIEDSEKLNKQLAKKNEQLKLINQEHKKYLKQKINVFNSEGQIRQYKRIIDQKNLQIQTLKRDLAKYKNHPENFDKSDQDTGSLPLDSVIEERNQIISHILTFQKESQTNFVKAQPKQENSFFCLNCLKDKNNFSISQQIQRYLENIRVVYETKFDQITKQNYQKQVQILDLNKELAYLYEEKETFKYGSILELPEKDLLFLKKESQMHQKQRQLQEMIIQLKKDKFLEKIQTSKVEEQKIRMPSIIINPSNNEELRTKNEQITKLMEQIIKEREISEKMKIDNDKKEQMIKNILNPKRKISKLK